MHIGIYMRLSKEADKDKAESNSISNQRILLNRYVSEKFPDNAVQEFADDGFSGLNFCRPGIQRLLGQVRDSKIDCIVVKDFSRFSRDYIELGSYLEQIFPFMGIRFISVNDRYDSESETGGSAQLAVHFKSLLYDLYSRDLSQKVRASLAVKKAKGDYVSANCPFGYEKSLDDRHMLLIEEDEAEIVRRIFKLTACGYTSVQIADLFNEEGVKTPIEFKIEKGKTTRNPKGGRFLWSASFICQVLKNPVYAGDIAYGKYKRDFPGGRNRSIPREQWLIAYNHHQPVIERDLFEQIQKNRGKPKAAQYHKTHPLTGKAVCGCCKRNLRYRSSSNPYFYCCQKYLTGQTCGKQNTELQCVKKINAMFLEQYILFYLQKRLEESTQAKDLMQKPEKIRECMKDFIRCITVFDEKNIVIEWELPADQTGSQNYPT